MLTRILLVLSAVSSAHGLNIALFAPHMANSQIVWNKRVGETLAAAGHNVTVYVLSMFDHNEPWVVEFDEKIHLEFVNATTGINGTELLQFQAQIAFQNIPLWDKRYREAMSRFGQMWKHCHSLVHNATFLDHVRASKFDVAFPHMYNFCTIGIIHATNIPSWIWLNSAALLDNVASTVGVPVPPSYCPPLMMDAGDDLSFFERTKSFIGHAIYKATWPRFVVAPETKAFREAFGDDFPALVDLATKAPLVMVNSNEMYDFPRPTLAKVVNIGGVGVKKTNSKPLAKEYADRVASAKDGIIVMSFGSVAPMYLMPESWKDSYFNAFRKFPNVQFFLRYEHPDEIASLLPPNAYASKWLPQNDLLHHPKALGLISHGGYNSLQDVIHAGVPILATALFGDQFRNAHLAVRLGLGIKLDKDDVNGESVEIGVRRLIEDRSLKEAAVRIRGMVATRPVSSETLLVRWTEFVAQHKVLDNLIPPVAEMSWFVYHSLDVITFLTLVVLGVLGIVFAILRCCFRCVCRCCSSPGDKVKTQ